MAKTKKIYKVGKTTSRNNRTTYFEGTLEYLINNVFGYTLECGKSWEHEKGNKKIDTKPKTIKSLITNLNNAQNNSAANSYSGVDYFLAQ